MTKSCFRPCRRSRLREWCSQPWLTRKPPPPVSWVVPLFLVLSWIFLSQSVCRLFSSSSPAFALRPKSMFMDCAKEPSWPDAARDDCRCRWFFGCCRHADLLARLGRRDRRLDALHGVVELALHAGRVDGLGGIGESLTETGLHVLTGLGQTLGDLLCGRFQQVARLREPRCRVFIEDRRTLADRLLDAVERILLAEQSRPAGARPR